MGNFQDKHFFSYVKPSENRQVKWKIEIKENFYFLFFLLWNYSYLKASEKNILFSRRFLLSFFKENEWENIWGQSLFSLIFFFFNTFLGHNVFLGGNEAEKKNWINVFFSFQTKWQKMFFSFLETKETFFLLWEWLKKRLRFWENKCFKCFKKVFSRVTNQVRIFRTNFPSAWSWGANDWIYNFRWTVPLIE